MKTRTFALGLMMAVLLVAQSAAQAGEHWKEVKDVKWPGYITMLGASAGGNAILSVSAIAQMLSQKAPVQAVAQVTAGATQNMYLIEEEEGTYAWGSAQYIYDGKLGRSVFAERPVKIDLAVIAEYSVTYYQVAGRKGSGIKSIQDMRGKRVVVGAPGSGTETMIRSLMIGVGLYKDGKYDFQAEYSGVQEGCEMIANDQADATIIGGTIPFSAFIELFMTDAIEIIPFTQDEVKAIVALEAGFTPATIPAGSYEGKVPNELLTVATKSGLVCRADLPEEEVYGLVRILDENWKELGTYHDLFTQMPFAKVCDVDTAKAPLHPGAVRYFKEMGYMK